MSSNQEPIASTSLVDPYDGESVSSILSKNRQTANQFMVSKLEREAAKNWDKFYKRHQDRFFHDRHWTDREFDALKTAVSSDADDGSPDPQEMVLGNLQQQPNPVLLEVGCGVGNMLYPLLDKNPNLKVHCCDFSTRAVDIVKQHPKYDSERVNAFVYDLCSESDPTLSSLITPPLSSLPPSIPQGPTLISSIFVLSAIPPSLHVKVISNLFSLLSPGGTLLFRDYAKGDLAQLRFHQKEKWAEPSLLSEEYDYYRRGDGTMTFFFSLEYMQEITNQLEKLFGKELVMDQSHAKVIERVGANKKRGINLRRCFVQAVWKKKSL
ncbi:unnamed protein product [Sympodiomycopsis kandeliae]